MSLKQVIGLDFNEGVVFGKGKWFFILTSLLITKRWRYYSAL